MNSSLATLIFAVQNYLYQKCKKVQNIAKKVGNFFFKIKQIWTISGIFLQTSGKCQMDAKKVGTLAWVIWLPTPCSECQISRIWHRKCQSGHPVLQYLRDRPTPSRGSNNNQIYFQHQRSSCCSRVVAAFAVSPWIRPTALTFTCRCQTFTTSSHWTTTMPISVSTTLTFTLTSSGQLIRLEKY